MRIARYFHLKGINVSGYDKTETPYKEIGSEGNGDSLYRRCNRTAKRAASVVYTPAVPKDHADELFYKDNNYIVVKRSDVLRAITAVIVLIFVLQARMVKQRSVL